MKQKGMTATKLRALLVVLIIMLIGLAGVGFYFGQQILGDYAATVRQTVANSTASGNDVQSLKKLQEELVARQDIIAKANTLFATNQDYQNQVIKDLGTYAAKTGISISNYGFSAASAVGATGTPSTSVTITVGNPVSYTSLLAFMAAVEGSVPKMQIGNLTLTRIDGDSNSVSTAQMTVEVYTR